MRRASAASNWPTAARSCSTKSPRSTCRCKPSCCACCRRRSFERVGSSQTQSRRCARAGHDQSRPAARSRRRPVPPGPVLPAGRRAARRAAAARAARRRAGAGRALSRAGAPTGWAKQPCELEPPLLDLLVELSLAGQRSRAGEHRHAGQRAEPGATDRGRRAAALADRRRRQSTGRRPTASAGRAEPGRHGTQTDRSHARALRRPPGQDGRGPGHRHSHALGQTERVRLRPAAKRFAKAG